MSVIVRTEAFVTVVVPEDRIVREARECGGGLEGRARVLYGLMSEVEAQLRGGMAMTQVSWLTSPQLALACRTGFAPADRAGIIDALAQREKDAGVNADVPWAMAGPSGADPLVRHYSHDASLMSYWAPASRELAALNARSSAPALREIPRVAASQGAIGSSSVRPTCASLKFRRSKA